MGAADLKKREKNLKIMIAAIRASFIGRLLVIIFLGLMMTLVIMILTYDADVDEGKVLIIEGSIDAVVEDLFDVTGPGFGVISTGKGYTKSLGQFSYSSFLVQNRDAPVPHCELPNAVLVGLRGSTAFVFDKGVLLMKHIESLECYFEEKDTFHIDAKYDVVGGTGLFEGAKGEVIQVIDGVSPFPFPFTNNFVGTIELSDCD